MRSRGRRTGGRRWLRCRLLRACRRRVRSLGRRLSGGTRARRRSGGGARPRRGLARIPTGAAIACDPVDTVSRDVPRDVARGPSRLAATVALRVGFPVVVRGTSFHVAVGPAARNARDALCAGGRAGDTVVGPVVVLCVIRDAAVAYGPGVSTPRELLRATFHLRIRATSCLSRGAGAKRRRHHERHRERGCKAPREDALHSRSCRGTVVGAPSANPVPANVRP